MNSNGNQNCYLGGRHFSQTVNQNVYEKVKSKTQKFVKIIRGFCNICRQNQSKTFNF